MQIRFGYWMVLVFGLLTGCSESNRRQARIPAAPQSPAAIERGAALESLTRAINQSGPASAYAKRAAIYLKAGQLDTALADINEALDRDDDIGRYHLIKAQVLRSRHQYDDALESALRAEGLGVDTPELYILIGDLLQEQREFDRARIYLVKALQMAPYEGEAFYYNGLVVAKTGDTVRALPFLRRSLQLKPRYLEPYVQLAAIYAARRDLPVAFTYNNVGMRYFPNNPWLLYTRGVIYQQMYKSDSAYQFFQRAIQLQPTLYQAHFQAGLVCLKWRSSAQALQHFDQVVKQDPNFPRVRYYMAVGYEQTGQWDQAINSFAAALQADPANQQARYGLWRVQRRQMGYGGGNSYDEQSYEFSRPGEVLDTTRVRVKTIQPKSRFSLDSTRN